MLVAQRYVVVSACSICQRAGVRPGMSLAEARALVDPPMLIRQHTPQRDLAALGALAQWALRFSPVVSLDPPAGLLIDITGCHRVFTSEQALAAKVVRSTARMGLSARVAVAPTFTLARALARWAPGTISIVEDGQARTSLAELPVAALDLAPETEHAMAELGLKTIDDLLALPRASIPSRFGLETLTRLDQTLGRAPEIIDPITPIEPPWVERVFDGPTTQVEAIHITTRTLIERLATRLAQDESGVLKLDITLDRIGSDPVRFGLSLARPSRNVKHLWALIRPKLETANLGYGVERIELRAPRAARIKHAQAVCWASVNSETDDAESAFWELVDTLATRLGPDQVLRAELALTHAPERTARWRSIVEPAPRAAPDPEAIARLVADRPSLLLDHPVAVQVLAVTPDGPVARLMIDTLTMPITWCSPPERISHEWWRVSPASSPPLPTRDYFKLITETGRVLWVYREVHTSRWFLHGEWA